MDILGQFSSIASVMQDLFSAFSESITFSVIKFILGIYTTVLIVDIILLLVQRGIAGDVRHTKFGMNVPAALVQNAARKKAERKWKKIKSRLTTDQESQFKLAIIEADQMIDKLIAGMGYGGENLGRRLENVPPGQLEDIASIKEAHEVRNRIILEEDFEIDRDLAEKTLALFEEFLRTHQVVRD
jgi:hypothetical protein